MADEFEARATSSKRVRLSSDAQNEFVEQKPKLQCLNNDIILTKQESKEKEANFDEETLGEPADTREQYGDLSDYELPEKLDSDDFPSCFSVENEIGNEEEHHYQPVAGPMGWIKRQMDLGIGPRDILAYMAPYAQIPSDVEDGTLWKIVIDILTEPTPRHKLDNVNTIDDVVDLLQRSRNIIVLTGAGVSVSCGIPDFRSRDGIYARLSAEYPDLPDPQAMFDISYFYNNPRPFFKFAKEIYPGQFMPSLSHRFIHQLETNQQLLRNYSQNIDTLEQVAGIRRVIQCHGSFSTASCTNCGYKVSSDVIKQDIFNQIIPLCPKCPQDKDTFAVMKPDIVFFGESLPADFYESLESDSEKADLLIVIGSSLKVRPVALIPSHIPPEIPQILINREPLRHMTFDVELLGDCDAIIAELCERLGKPWIQILRDFEVPSVDSTVLSRAQTPPLLNGSSPVADTTTDGRAVDHAYTDVLLENNKNRQLPSSIDTTELPGTKQRNSPCNTNTDLPGAENCDVNYHDASNTDKFSETSGRTHLAAHNYSPQICNDNTNERPRFIFMPPSRFVFHGAEIMDSPLPSPDARQLASLHHSSSDCSLESKNEGEGGSLSPTTTEGSYCSSDSEGSDLEKIRVSSGVGMALITGGLSKYTCESEESSLMSFTDVAAGEAKDVAAADFRGSGEIPTNTAMQHLVCKAGCEGRGEEATDDNISTEVPVGAPAGPAMDVAKRAAESLPVSGSAREDETAAKALPGKELTNQTRATSAANLPSPPTPASKGDAIEEETSSLKKSSERCRVSAGDDDSENRASARITESDTYTNIRGTRATGTRYAASPTEFTAALEPNQSQKDMLYNVGTNSL